MKGLIIHYNGIIEEVESAKADEFTLEQLQIIVGGYIEVIYSLKEGDDRVMIVDEDGKMKERFYNKKATEVLVGQFGYVNDFIAGDALVIRRDMLK